MLTRQRVLELFDYNPETGDLLWRPRQLTEFPAEKHGLTWNTAHAGKVAGYRHHLGYTCIRFDGRFYLAHRIIWMFVHGHWPNVIDHINRDRTDNRLSNLRNVSYSENNRNKAKTVRAGVGSEGVSWVPGKKRWRAYIYVEGRYRHLGVFTDHSAALAVRKAAEAA